MIARLDHVNLQTTRLAEMIAWYEDILHLKNGARPPFKNKGAWIYAGDIPVVHLSEIGDEPQNAGPLALEHMAFRAAGLGAFLQRLRAAGQRFRVANVPDMPIVQINVWDPDGNHMHIDFDAGEVEGVDLADFEAR